MVHPGGSVHERGQCYQRYDKILLCNIPTRSGYSFSRKGHHRRATSHEEIPDDQNQAIAAIQPGD